ncbi:unnamed protein product [Caenorhabditis nigoni]
MEYQMLCLPVNLPTNDITTMHEAIPFLPVPVAITCLLFNIFIPGSGTIISGFSALCMGQPRINMKEGRKLITLVVNLLVGISQFFTITFLFVGWFWSIAWGGFAIPRSPSTTSPGSRCHCSHRSVDERFDSAQKRCQDSC